ncbi:MAG: Uma2 family endonuclease [Desulfobulbaceae bacterium]|jgi:Uma2 family endonuclease|nr:Uma2 family endonuclease [Desulfobulbaceae bacterium]
MPLSLPQLSYTYADYATWPDDARYELIDGEAYLMSPAPKRAHQEICGEIFRQLADYLEGKDCRAFIAPFDVRLNAKKADDTVVQPDIVVVCDPKKLDEHGCVGAPDMVVEVLSPSSIKHDKMVKLELYRRHGVREYWTVDPDILLVEAHILRDNEYFIHAYGDSGEAPVSLFADCRINLDTIFRYSPRKNIGDATPSVNTPPVVKK